MQMIDCDGGRVKEGMLYNDQKLRLVVVSNPLVYTISYMLKSKSERPSAVTLGLYNWLG
jgi:hypothetical protein